MIIHTSFLTYTSKYKNSYDRSLVKKYKKSENFRILGMGGSILGTEAIYQFLKHKNEWANKLSQ